MFSFIKGRIKFALDVLLVLFFLAMLLQKIPSWISLNKEQGKTLLPTVLLDKNDQRVMIPVEGKKVVVIWATWCAPCRVELSRLSRYFKAHKIIDNALWVISLGETNALVQKTAQSRNYSFPVFSDQESSLANQFSIASTPTVLFFDDQGVLIKSLQGVSPMFEWHLNKFFN